MSVKKFRGSFKERKMPTYEDKGKDHGHIFEGEQEMSDGPLATCQTCGAQVEPLTGMTSITLAVHGPQEFGVIAGTPQLLQQEFHAVHRA